MQTVVDIDVVDHGEDKMFCGSRMIVGVVAPSDSDEFVSGHIECNN